MQRDCSSQHFRENRSVALVDEAHRTQYKVDAVAMRKAMPNAVFFAFSGTPIDKKNGSTYKVFGPLLDKYSFDSRARQRLELDKYRH